MLHLDPDDIEAGILGELDDERVCYESKNEGLEFRIGQLVCLSVCNVSLWLF